jgi:N-acyl-D-aspartate/D-glutamate deacylase
MGLLDVAEAVRRCTLVPAQILEGVSPDMKRKGRVQVGADADIVVFDAESIADRATYASPVETSIGIAHVIVNGVSVVCDGTLEPKALPGRAIRGAATLAGAR